MRAHRIGVLLAALLAFAAPARADWPDKPIRIIVTFAPGGAAELGAHHR